MAGVGDEGWDSEEFLQYLVSMETARQSVKDAVDRYISASNTENILAKNGVGDVEKVQKAQEIIEKGRGNVPEAEYDWADEYLSEVTAKAAEYDIARKERMEAFKDYRKAVANQKRVSADFKGRFNIPKEAEAMSGFDTTYSLTAPVSDMYEIPEETIQQVGVLYESLLSLENEEQGLNEKLSEASKSTKEGAQKKTDEIQARINEVKQAREQLVA